jgi:thiol peroxidase
MQWLFDKFFWGGEDMKIKTFFIYTTVTLMLMFGCATYRQPDLLVEPGSVPPGTKVTRKGIDIDLLGNPISVKQRLPAMALVDGKTMHDVNLSNLRGDVLFLSIVPSIDTKVCEAQTHYLGEAGDSLPADIKRITISRDTPFAQQRFAESAKLTDIQYLSDYKEGRFGKSMGLLMDGPRLLARSIILVDRQGIVRYIQVVPEMTNLPDMERAFDKARELSLE